MTKRQKENPTQIIQKSLQSDSLREEQLSIGDECLLVKRLSLSIFHFGSSSQVAKDEALALPLTRYHIDPYLLALAQQRHRNCTANFADDAKTIFAVEELAFLGRTSASEYFRGHELLAYHYFVENMQSNGLYTDQLAGAELEYLPILPLSWRSSRPNCGWSSFIQMLLKMHTYLIERDAKLSEQRLIVPRRFMVASTFNMRSEWGKGMPTPYRKGPAWEAMSAFTQSLTIGHYERWPECPDLLRKWWKYAVELPYLPPPLAGSLDSFIIDRNSSSHNNSRRGPQQELLANYLSSQKRAHFSDSWPWPAAHNLPWLSQYNHSNTTTANDDSTMITKREFLFFFSGHYDLPGPDMVCSTRNTILSLSQEREPLDLLVINATRYDHSKRGVQLVVAEMMARSLFCLIIPGDSYSSSSLFTAIASGCLPVIVNDWLALPYPWLIPYASFVIRVSEEDWLQDPHVALDTIKNMAEYNPEIIIAMQRAMAIACKDYLSFTSMPRNSSQYKRMMSADRFLSLTEEGITVPAWELLLLELRYELDVGNGFARYENVPCARPLWCASNVTAEVWKRRGIVEIDDNNSKDKKKKERVARFDLEAIRAVLAAATDVNIPSPSSRDMPFLDNANSSSVSMQCRLQAQQYHNDNKQQFFALKVDDYFEVHSLYLPPAILTDLRPHTCRHRGRLVGIFKVVFYMQCVRVLWTLNPGKFKPKDHVNFLLTANNQSSLLLPSYEQEGLTREERDFLLSFHNVEKYRPPGWVPYPYPIAGQHVAHYSRHPNRSVLLEKRSKWNEKRVVQLQHLLQ